MVVATDPFATPTFTKLTLPFVLVAVPMVMFMSPLLDELAPVLIVVDPVLLVDVPLPKVTSPDGSAPPLPDVTDTVPLAPLDPTPVVTANAPPVAVPPDAPPVVILIGPPPPVAPAPAVIVIALPVALPLTAVLVDVIVTSPVRLTRIVSTPRVTTCKGSAVDAASVPILQSTCDPLPPVDAEVSPIVKADCDAVVCAQFHAMALFAFAIVAGPVAATTLLKRRPCQIAAVELVAVNTCPEDGAVALDTATVVEDDFRPFAAVATATVPVVDTNVESPVGKV